MADWRTLRLSSDPETWGDKQLRDAIEFSERMMAYVYRHANFRGRAALRRLHTARLALLQSIEDRRIRDAQK